eukprot:SAG11_NODE_24263_length_375_cov_1865.137681_1_plen_82_part_10
MAKARKLGPVAQQKPKRGVRRKTARLKPYYDYNRNEALRMRQVYQNISTIQEDSRKRQQIESEESLKRWVGREKQLYSKVLQ